MGNVPQQIFFEHYQSLEPSVLLSVAEGGQFVVLGSENSSTPNAISFCDLNGSYPEYTSVELGVTYGLGLNSRVFNSRAIGYLYTSYIAKVILSYPITGDPHIQQYPRMSGTRALHPKEDCLVFYNSGNLHFLEPNFDLTLNITTSNALNFSIEEIDGSVTYLLQSGNSVFRIQEHSYLQNYSSAEEIDLGSNLLRFGFNKKNQLFGKFNRNDYNDMTTTFLNGNFNPLTIQSSVSLVFQRYHFEGFSRMEDKILFTHQLFTGQTDQICTVPFSVSQSSIILDWEGQPCRAIQDGLDETSLVEANFHGYQYFIGKEVGYSSYNNFRIYDSDLNQVDIVGYDLNYYLNKQNAVITYYFDYDYPNDIHRTRVNYIVENVAVWFAVVMGLVGLIALALIIVGTCFAKCKYEEWKERRRNQAAGMERNERVEQNISEMNLNNRLCNICDGSKCHTKLGCGHTFHEQCLGRFIAKIGNQCPTCGRAIK